MAGDEETPKPRRGEPSPIPANEFLSDELREQLKQRRHEAGLARSKAGREGRNDPYVEESSFAPEAQHHHPHEGGESKQAHGDASSGPDRTPDLSRGNRKGDRGPR